MGIEVIVFDTLEAKKDYLDAAFKANADIINSAISKYHNNLDMKPENMGRGLELKCIVQLYGIGKNYDFAAGVRSWGEFVDVTSAEYKSVSRMPAAIRRVLQQHGPLYTAYGYTLVHSFHTCMEEANIFSEEQIKNINESSLEAIKEIGKDKGLTAAVKRFLRKAANELVDELSKDSVMRGLTHEEREAFVKAYSSRKR